MALPHTPTRKVSFLVTVDIWEHGDEETERGLIAHALNAYFGPPNVKRFGTDADRLEALWELERPLNYQPPTPDRRESIIEEHVRLNPDLVRASESDLRELASHGEAAAAKELERRREGGKV